MGSIKDKSMSIGIRQAIKLVKKDPQKNMIKALDIIRMADTKNLWVSQYDFMENILKDPTNIWNQYIVELFDTIDEEIINKFAENFIINSVIKGYSKNLDFQEEHGLKAPWVIVMDPTTACNMHCTGCWAAEYGNALNLGYDLMDRIVREGKEVGVYFYVFTGGEPLVKKDEVLKLCEAHPDCLFLAFTNGTIIDDEFAKKARKLANLYFSLSVEGTQESTDARRGKGAYENVLKAMQILKDNKCLFGYSTCATSQNADYIMSEEYLDKMIDAGCKYGWYFNFMPVGCGTTTELLTTPQQRKDMYYKLKEYRNSKKIFTIDFWNDGRYVGGCIAGGKHYMHINANGDVEPCVFVHYSNANIKDMPLKQCLQQPLFREYQANQPFSDDLLRPCPLLDNSGKLAQMVHKVGAHSTDMASPEDVDDLNAKTKEITDAWKPVADELWESYNEEVEANKKGEKVRIEIEE